MNKKINTVPREEWNAYLAFGTQKATKSPSYIQNYQEAPDANGKYIKWGKDNKFPYHLIDLARRSPLHQSILSLKSMMIAGNGLVNNEWEQITAEFLSNGGGSNDTIEELEAKNAVDFTIFNGFAVCVIWAKDGTIAELSHINPATIRFAYDASIPIEEQVESYLLCSDWRRVNHVNGFKPIEMAAYDPNNRTGAQIYFYRSYVPSGSWYPEPDYLAGIDVIETDIEINLFHKSTIQRQFAPSMVMTYPEFTPKNPEEMYKVVTENNKKFMGALKAGEVMHIFSPSKDKTPTIAPVEMANTDSRYMELKKSVTENIGLSHKLTDPALMGIKQQNVVFSKNNLLEALSIFQATYICIFQKKLESVFNKFARQNGVEQKITIDKYSSNLTPDIAIGEMIALLTSTITDKQKVAILEGKGFTKQEALNYVDKGDAVETPPNDATKQIVGDNIKNN